MDWRLRIRGPGFVETLSVSSASTLGELMEDIKEKIKINSFQVKAGYPPRMIDLRNLSAPLNTLFHDNDTVLIETSGAGLRAKSKSAAKKSKSTSPKVVTLSSLPPSSPPSNPSVVSRLHEDTSPDFVPDMQVSVPVVAIRKSTRKRKVRDVHFVDEEEPPTKKARNAKQKDGVKKTGIHGLHSPLVPQKPKRKPQARRKVASPTASVADPPISSAIDMMDSSDPFNIVLAESSIAMQMLSTVESGDFLRNELTQRGQEEGRSFLRNAFDVGLKVAQEETLASHRYESILSLTYKIEKVEKGGKFELLCSFPTDGLQMHSETVEFLEPYELAAIVAFVIASDRKDAQLRLTDREKEKEGASSGRELLKPLKMAFVFHFGPSIEGGLLKLYPTLDWSFLDSRYRIRSEAAIRLEKERKERETRRAAKELGRNEKDGCIPN